VTEHIHVPTSARVLAASDGDILRSVRHVSNRFMIDG